MKINFKILRARASAIRRNLPNRSIPRAVTANLGLLFVLTITLGRTYSQQQAPASPGNSNVATTSPMDANGNLPAEPIGTNDLLGITVYDAPELTRSVRVDANGSIRLPMVSRHIKAVGLFPEDLEKSIRMALIDEQVLVDPIVTVSIIEYRSRTINVIGQVRNPVMFQAIGRITLLDALSRAGGVTESAGPEILVSSQPQGVDANSAPLVRRIPIASLYDSTDDSMNITLTGGELIRVPEAGRFFVLGNVKSPGAFPVKNGSDTTVLKALALSGGLQPFPGKLAYIYRTESGSGGKGEVQIELKKVINHDSPDVSLKADDILYIPEASGKKTTMSIARTVGMMGASVGTTLLYIYH
jgi:polysaccharide export outer membrane protein